MPKKTKTNKPTTPVTVVAIEFRDGEFFESMRVDNIHAVGPEDAAQTTARQIRLGWARKTVSEWLAMAKVAPVEPTLTAVSSDGSRAPVTTATVRSVVTASEGVTEGAERWTIKASAPVPIASMAPTPVPSEPSKAYRDATIANLRAGVENIKRKYPPIRVPQVAPIAGMTPLGVADQTRAARPTSMVLATAVYTIGIDAGITPSRMLEIIDDHVIAYVVDTRAQDSRIPGWSFAKTRANLGDRYRKADSLMDVVRLCPKGARVLLLRKEEAPGDNAFHLEIARTLPVVHLYRAEEIKGAALQAAIDADAVEPAVDHLYPCMVDVHEAAAEQASA